MSEQSHTGRINYRARRNESGKNFREVSELDASANGVLDTHVIDLINNALHEREARENARANLRNRNRMFALFAVLLVEMIMPVVFSSHLLPASWAQYEVLIITMPDALITAYAWLRKY